MAWARRFVLAFLLFQTPDTVWHDSTPLPRPVSNNAVASLEVKHRTLLFSFMGIGAKKTWDDISREAWVYDPLTRKWSPSKPVPGAVGRIAATAVGMGGHVYLFGGYSVDKSGNETTARNVDVYTPSTEDPAKGIWSKGADIPVPVDDTVAVPYWDRYIILISGWHDTDNVADVQVYDTVRDSWHRAAPIRGTPVFGHAGGISGNTIIYCGGAYKNPHGGKPRYIASEECWKGTVRLGDTVEIEWSPVPAHPGLATYRMAAGGFKKWIVFAGGTSNPYNYNGNGYDERPAQPSKFVFAWNTKTSEWETWPSMPAPTMDHRGLVPMGESLVIIGGMEAGQKITAKIQLLRNRE